MKTYNLQQQGVSEHTGFPNAATDRSLATLDLNTLLIKHPVSTFFMRIRGNEWEDRGIFDKDIMLIDRALSPRSIDLVIWWQEDTFMISKLQAVPAQTEIWGVVTTVIHRYH